MQVKLQANWYGPDNRRYRKGVDGGLTYIPDELRPFLPSTAKVVSEGGEFEAPKVEPGTTLRDFDEARHVSDAEGEMAAKAEALRKEEMDKGAEELLRKRQEHAAKMRAAKAAKARQNLAS